ncbi:IS3 family transposase [Bacillus subtilis]
MANEWIAKGYAFRKVLKILEISPSTYYYQYKKEEKSVSEGRPIPGYSLTKNGKKIPDEQIQEWLMELISGEAGVYGYRKLCLRLRSEYALQINKKKVYRLCKELDILQPQREVKFHYPRKLARNRIITESNQLWEADIKYGYIEGEERFFFILSLIDVYDRSITDYHIGLHCTGHDAGQLVQRALFKRQQFERETKPVIRTDNGPQFISLAFQKACETFHIEHERIPPRTPNMNAHIESFHRLLEYECLRRFAFHSYADAYHEVAEYMDFYNNRRIHSSILDLAPNEFYQRNQTEELTIKEVRV